MDIILTYIESHVSLAPYICFIALILAGFNIPISEDLIIISSGLLAINNPDYTIPLFLGFFLGAYAGDIISFSIGRYFGIKIWSIPFLSRMIKPKHFNRAKKYFKNHGFLTLIIGRFIPFGVRNGIFITAGVTGQSYKTFWYRDLIACFISNITLYTLTIKFGERIYQFLSIYRIPALIVFIITAGLIVFFNRKKSREEAEDEIPKELIG